MYLTRLVLNTRSKPVRRDLANPYDMHRTLTAAVAKHLSDERLLWRVDERRGALPVVLVQTWNAPDWEHLDSGYCDEQPSVKWFEFQPLSGTVCRFRLRANPCTCTEGRRHGITAPDLQLAWLARQGSRHGFEVISAIVMRQQPVKAHKDGKILTLCSALFDGALEVTAEEAFGRCVRNGIGHGKGLGLGLLSLARLDVES